MEKIRIYELAKELNTTSKRLIEKLAEINIDVKNHMSYLDVQKLETLYNHIGVVSYDKEKKDIEKEEPLIPTPQDSIEEKKREIKGFKSAPRIIRTTEIIHDEKPKEEPKFDKAQKQGQYGRDRRSPHGGRTYGSVQVGAASSGLRSGYVRDTGVVTVKDKGKAQQKDKLQDKVQEKTKTKIEKQVVEEVETKTGKKADVKTEKKIDTAKSDKLDTNMKEIDKKVAIDTVEKVEVKIGKKEEPKIEEKIKDEVIVKDKAEIKPKEETKERLKKEEDKEKPKEETGKRPKEEIKVRPKEGARRKPREEIKERSGEETKEIFKEKDEKRIEDKKGKRATERPEMQIKETGKHTEKREHKRTSEETKVKPLEIPKPDPKVEPEQIKKHGYKDKDFAKESRREQKREVPRSRTEESKKKKIKTREILIADEGTIDSLALDKSPGKAKVKKTQRTERHRDKDRERVKDRDRSRAAKFESRASIMAQKSMLVSISIPKTITVKELSENLKKTSSEVIKKLIDLGLMVTVNEVIDFDTAALVADEFGVKAEKAVIVNEEDILFDDGEDSEEDLEARPPVVVVMGHVDHGKTSLLDAIRKTNVIESEEGGITQHIGAYTVKVNNRNITFLDTPGHEAFTAMRARGAQVTDIAILVVSADDGVMPQTVEAINHAKAANISIIVAVNKIDKPGANPERVMQQLTEYGLVAEAWGGDVVVVPISALKGENIDLLLEMVLLTSDMLELKANPKKQAKGTIIEAKLDKNRGPVATLLVQRGTINVGDSILTGAILGRIKAMTDDKNHSIKSAPPSTPVEVLGFPEVPESGEIFYAIEDERVAKNLMEKRRQRQREQQLRSSSRVTLDDLFEQIQEGKVKELNLIIKADVQGSVEAVRQSMEKLNTNEVKINIIHDGVGGITETDIKLAEVSNAIVIGFNVRPGINVSEIAKNSGVDIRLYRVIYNAIEDIEAAMKGMLDPKFEEAVIGHAEIRQIFKASGVGTIGGSYVTDGKITRNADVRVVRDSIVIYEGKLASLKRFKDDIREVAQGYECGILVEKFNDIKEGDIIEAYIMKKIEHI